MRAADRDPGGNGATGWLEASERAVLLELARESIGCGLRAGPRPRPQRGFPASLMSPAASFVTLNVHAELRGCCGSIEPHRSLVDDVWHNAFASAFLDPRFPALTGEEYAIADFEITVLSALESIRVAGEAELLEQLVPFVDGLVLELGHRRATFLPKVWESLPSPDQFVRQLKLKAGWPEGFWSSSMRCLRYRAISFNR